MEHVSDAGRDRTRWLTADEEAAWRALKAQPHFKQGGFEVNLSGSFLGKGLIKATVTAEYHCLFAYVNVVCGGGTRALSATAAFPYQGAPIVWEN